MPARLVLAALAFVVLFHPDWEVATFASVPVALFVAYWLLWRRNVPVVARAGGG